MRSSLSGHPLSGPPSRPLPCPVHTFSLPYCSVVGAKLQVLSQELGVDHPFPQLIMVGHLHQARLSLHPPRSQQLCERLLTLSFLVGGTERPLPSWQGRCRAPSTFLAGTCRAPSIFLVGTCRAPSLPGRNGAPGQRGQEVAEQVGPAGLTPAHLMASVSTGRSPRTPIAQVYTGLHPAAGSPLSSMLHLSPGPTREAPCHLPPHLLLLLLLGPAPVPSSVASRPPSGPSSSGPVSVARPCLPESACPEDVEMESQGVQVSSQVSV